MIKKILIYGLTFIIFLVPISFSFAQNTNLPNPSEMSVRFYRTVVANEGIKMEATIGEETNTWSFRPTQSNRTLFKTRSLGGSPIGKFSSRVIARNPSSYSQLTTFETDNKVHYLLYKVDNKSEADYSFGDLAALRIGDTKSLSYYKEIPKNAKYKLGLIAEYINTNGPIEIEDAKTEDDRPAYQRGEDQPINDEVLDICETKEQKERLLLNNKDQYWQLLDKLNNAWGDEIFERDEISEYVSEEKDQYLYSTYFKNANLEEQSSGNTYQSMLNFHQDVELLLATAWGGEQDADRIQEEIDNCTKGIGLGAALSMAAIGGKIGGSKGAAIGGLAGVGACLGTGYGVEELLQKLSSTMKYKKPLAQQVLALYYLDKYVEYRQCLAENSEDEKLKETIDKEVKNYNSILKLAEDQQQRYGDTRGNDFLAGIINKMLGWVEEILGAIYEPIIEWLNKVPV